jgi:hypothetical protein
MRPADDIKKLIEQLEDKTNAEFDKKTLDDVFLSMKQVQSAKLQKSNLNIRRIIMKSPITKIAAAAVIIIAAAYFLSTKISITTPAFADIFKQIYKADSVVYNQTFFTGSSKGLTLEQMIQQGFTGKNMTTQSGILRDELQGGAILLFDFADNKTMQLEPAMKKAILTYHTGRKRTQNVFNWLDWVSRLHEKDGKFIGKENLNEIQTNVYIVEMPFEKTTVWVDPETNLPVQVIMVDFPNPDKDIVVPQISLSESDFGSKNDFGGQGGYSSSITIGSGRGSPEGIQKEMTQILTNFVWNCHLDDSLFSMEPPEGYSLEEKQFDVSEPGEKNLIEALAFWAEMSEGSFPSNINDLCDPNLINPKLIKKYDKDSAPQQELEQAMVKANIILKGLYFAQELKANQNWNYNSEGVKLGDSNIPLCWWKKVNSEQCRVIYADLSIADVNAEDLTQRP